MSSSLPTYDKVLLYQLDRHLIIGISKYLNGREPMGILIILTNSTFPKEAHLSTVDFDRECRGRDTNESSLLY